MRTRRPVPTDWQVERVGDFNGDGMSDIVWRHDSGLVTNWLGTANGSFVNNHAHSAALVPVERRITGVGDFNGDGNSDILWQNDTELLTNWLGTDSGGFVRNDAVALARLRFDVEETGDFNGDGRDDILVGDDWGFISAYLARPDGSFILDDYNPFADATDKPLASVGDFNGDGIDEVLWRTSQGVEAEFASIPNFTASLPPSWRVQPILPSFGVWDY